MKLTRLLTYSVLCLSPLMAEAQVSPTKSITFNGTNQYMSIPHHADFNCGTDEELTVTAWVHLPNWNNQNQRFISKRIDGHSGDDKSGYELWGGNSSTNFFAINTPNTQANHANSLSAWSTARGNLNQWTHIALVVDRTTSRIMMYQNGAQVGISSGSVSAWAATNDFDVLIGSGWKEGLDAHYFSNATLANVRFYKSALTLDELAADKNTLEYASLSDAIKSKAVAAYDFSGITGYTVPDLTGKGHSGTLVNFAPVVSGALNIVEDNLIQDTNFTGRGNENEVILHSQLTVAGDTESVELSQMTMTLNGTTSISDIASVSIYSTGLNNHFDPRNPVELLGATLLGTANASTGEIVIDLNGSLIQGVNNIWITCDVAATAKEGNKVDATLVSLVTAEQTYSFANTTVSGDREILLARKLLFGHADKANASDPNTNYYRIPALITAKDGSLVTATDRRKNTINDLPADIDVVIRRSTDGGKTWSESKVIAAGTGEGAGFGDAALVQTNEENGLMCVFAGGPGLWTSRYNNPIRIYMCKSQDNGVNWSEPTDITSQIYGIGCTDAARSQWAALFISSGAGLKMSNGRIAFVGNFLPSAIQNASYIGNVMVYSDDNGATWQVSNIAKSNNGNEAKLVELNDGRILMSIRNQSKGARYNTISSDHGVTWGSINSWADMNEPGCNGDIIRYTSVNNGYEKNRLLHSVPAHDFNRENVSVYLSYNEGQTWDIKKSICKTGSAYSSLCILPDGTIGAYVEENYNTTPFNMYFVNVSLEWLSSGADTYLPADANVEVVASPQFSIQEGSYPDSQVLEITCETPDATIYYTLDGSQPSITSLVYTEPLNIETTTTVKAIAVKEGMSTSLITAARFEIYEPAYCVWEGGKRSGNDRYLSTLSFAVTSPAGEAKKLSVPISTAGSQTEVYLDRTAYELECTAGDDIKISFVKNALEWMHFYAYIDYNHDFVFDPENNELVSYSYLGNEGGNGFDSDGVARASSYCPASIPTFKIPANTKPGKTRLRFNVDWNTKDPCGDHAINGNRGSIIDIIINIKQAIPATLSIIQPEKGGAIVVKNGDEVVADQSQVMIGTQLTVEATPESAYVLKHILVNDAAIEGNTFVVEEENTVISAAFTTEKIMQITTSAGGVASVKQAETDIVIADGDWFAPGEYVFEALADETFEIGSVTINGEDQSAFISDDKLSFNCTLSLTENSIYSVTFVKRQVQFNYSFNTSLGKIVVKQGQLDIPSGTDIIQGSSVSVTITPYNNAVEVTSILINGVDKKDELLPVGNRGTFTLTVNEATTLEVVFYRPVILLNVASVKGAKFNVLRDYDLNTFEGTEIVDGDELNHGETLTIIFTPEQAFEDLPFAISVNNEVYTKEDLDEENGPLFPNDGGKEGYLFEHTVTGPLSLGVTFPTSVTEISETASLGYYDYSKQMLILTQNTSASLLNASGLVILQANSNVDLSHLPSGIYVSILQNGSTRSIIKFIK